MNSVSLPPRATRLTQASLFPEDAPGEDVALMQLGQALSTLGYRFTTVTPASHALVNKRSGNEWARDLRGVFGWSRPFEASIIPADIFELMQKAEVVARDGEVWRSLVRMSSLDDQLFFHSAYPTTEAESVFFGPDTYRFVAAIDRHLATHAAPVHRAVDIGCGAGPGAIAIASRKPQAEVLAVDINNAALRFARVNAALATTDNVKPCHSNLLNDVDGMFDLIVSNPPYLVDAAQRAYRHGGGPLGAGLSLDIIDAALPRLNPNGCLLLYTGAAIISGDDPFRAAAEQKLDNTKFSWRYQEIDPDVFGEELLCDAYSEADRIAVVALTVTRHD